MAKVKTQIIEVDTEAAQKSVKSLRQELKSLKDELLNTEQGTEEYNRLIQEAANIQHQLKEQMEEVNASAMDFGQIVGNVTKSLTGIASGLQATKAAMNLLGVENKNVIKSIQQMQNLMALTQGIAGIDEGIKAMKRLSLSMKNATGAAKLLGAALQPKILIPITLAITAVIAGLEKLKEHLDELDQRKVNIEIITTEGKVTADKTNKEIDEKVEERVNEVAEKSKAKIQNVVDSIGDLNISTQEANQMLIDYQRALANSEKDSIQLFNKNIAEFELQLDSIAKAESNLKRQKDAIERFMSSPDYIGDYAADKELIEDINGRLDSAIERTKIINNLILSTKKTIKEYKEDAANNLAEAQKLDIENTYNTYKNEKERNDIIAESHDERIKQYKENAELIKSEIELNEAKLGSDYKYTEEAKKLYDDYFSYLKLAADGNQTQLNKIDAQRYKFLNEYNKQFEEARKKLQYYIDILDGKVKMPELSIIEEDEEEDVDNTVLERVRNTIEQYNIIYESAYQMQKDLFDQEQKDLDLALNTKLISQEEYYNAVKVLNEREAEFEVSNAIRVTTATAQLMTSLLDGIAQNQDENTREGFERSKKLQIASATIDMLAGITSAIAGLFTTKSGPWDIALAAIQAATIAATGGATIAKISNTKFENSGSGVGSVNTSALQGLATPTVRTSDVRGASIESAVKDTRVFVTERDISSTQKKVQVSETEAQY